MDTQEYLQSLVDAARAAQKEFEKMSQEQVDAAAKAIGKAIYDHAEELAKMAVEETRMGRVDSKIAKCKNKSKSTWWRMKDQKSRGIIERDEVNGIMKVAKPIGVVGCVTATTNPVINPMHNSMCALKCGNAVIICPHPRAKGVGVRAVELMNEALDKLGKMCIRDRLSYTQNPMIGQINNMIETMRKDLLYRLFCHSAIVEDAYEAHTEILNALRNKDFDRCIRAVVDHIDTTKIHTKTVAKEYR